MLKVTVDGPIAAVGRSSLGGSGGMPPPRNFEPAESDSEAFWDSFEVLVAVVLQTDSNNIASIIYDWGAMPLPYHPSDEVGLNAVVDVWVNRPT